MNGSHSPCADVAESLASADSVLLLTHENPDGDGVGSMLALRLHLVAGGAGVVCAVPQGMPARYGFLPGAETVLSRTPSRQSDCAVALDCDGEARLGSALDAFRAAGRTLCIDHHEAENGFADVNWCDGSRAATGLMVYELLRHLSSPLTPDIATCLYCAIAADTGVFRFQNTSPEALATAAELVRVGADPTDIARRASDQMPLPKARLLGRALESLAVHAGGVLVAALSLEDFAEAEALPEHTDGIIDEIKRIEDARVIVLLREDEPGRWRVSLRSMGPDVAQVCRFFGGGGHRLAAGCELAGSGYDVAGRIVEALQRGVGS